MPAPYETSNALPLRDPMAPRKRASRMNAIVPAVYTASCARALPLQNTRSKPFLVPVQPPLSCH